MESCCIDVDPDCVIVILRDETRIARKEHTCGECRQAIRPGEKYTYEVGVFEGAIETHITCWLCRCIRRDFFPCGFFYGRLREDFYECHGWDYVNGPQPDVPAEIDEKRSANARSKRHVARPRRSRMRNPQEFRPTQRQGSVKMCQ